MTIPLRHPKGIIIRRAACVHRRGAIFRPFGQKSAGTAMFFTVPA
jgi:hypothetical protein